MYLQDTYNNINQHQHNGCQVIIKTHGSESRDQEEATCIKTHSREAKKKQHARASSGLSDHYSELFTRMTALKF